ncbi:MAG: hypothetical protein KAG89_20280 [Fulvimarina manganoxydans]|uniref:hypothetical protein n=1 Tax=Fulvimarina manganoxydans TaxID=937218 RepID=UPI0023531F74|nr:hypothetical protein [Fulvimarina manganoxydans]MCK5934497.1 hypothetical protein [Fulvimarina manganoxydans]
MAIDLIERFGTARNPEMTAQLWDAFIREIALTLNRVLSEAQGISETRAQLIQTTLFRVNEILGPAFARVLEYQTGGFLTAGIDEDTEVAFVEGQQTILIEATKRELFRPTPFVALTRSASTADLAIGQALGYDEETGTLVVDVIAVIGEGGTFDDVIVTATAGSVQAQHQFLTETRTARDEADDAMVAAEQAAQEAAEDAIATAADREQTGLDRIQTGLDRAAAEEARNLAQTFDPNNYYGKAVLYTKTETDDLIAAARDTILGGASTAFDTLLEIEARFADDDDTYATFVAQLAGKLNAASNLSDLQSKPTARSNLGLGSAAILNAGAAPNNLVQLDSSGRIPAVNGSLLTNLQAGGLVPLGSPIAVVNVAAAALTIPSGYDQYLVRFWNTYPEGYNASIGFRLSSNNGASWKSGSGDYSYVAASMVAQGAYVSATGSNWIPLHNPGRYWKVGSNSKGAGEIVLTNLGTSFATDVYGQTGYWDGPNSSRSVAIFSGATSVAGPFNAIQFLSDTGNITIFCQLYGIRKG